MAVEILQHVPVLAEHEKSHWFLNQRGPSPQAAEKLRENFVAEYPFEKIPDLKLDEFVIGKGAKNRSFCYRLEREMDVLGRILGARADKFGVYYGRTKTDASVKYRFASHWGSTLEEAFVAVKQAIVKLLQAAANDDMEAILENRISPLFKGKLLFIYNPEKYAPIYSERHLKFFVAHLDLNVAFHCGADLQRALMDYRATWPNLLDQPAVLYMRFLYDVFGHPPDNDSSDDSTPASLPLLADAVRGSQFITDLPFLSSGKKGGSGGHGKTDFEKREKRLRRIGDRGESIVFALEEQRLIQAGKTNLANRVKHISQEDDGAGFDILSYDEDGMERQIEVKATSAANLADGFYISSNELEKSATLGNYYIYLVFSAMSKKPEIFQMKHPSLKSDAFALVPVIYNVMPKVTVSETVSETSF